MNKKYKFILMLLIVLFAISSYFFIKEIAENKKENNIYEELQEIVKNDENSIQENDYTNASEDKSDNISTENSINPDDFYNLEKISKIKNSQDLQELKVQFLGKKSELSNLLKGLGALTAEERPKVGALVNEARKEIEEKLSIDEEQIKSKMLEEKIEKEFKEEVNIQ